MPAIDRASQEAGFILVELLVAMSIFSFMLLIIVVGFINIVRLHNQALASNVAQDNAQSAMNELVRAVRDAAEVVTPLPGTPSNTLCLASAVGPQQVYYLSPFPVTAATRLYRADDCTAKVNAVPLTSTSVQVSNFLATVKNNGTNIVKPQVELTLTVASSNGTTDPATSGDTIACGPSNANRTFCAAVTLTSGAVPR